MNHLLLLLLITLFVQQQLWAQHTFSIVAVDPETGEVGSAGATCINGAAGFGGAIIINDIIPGRGGVNAQASVCINPNINLDNAIDQMNTGSSPSEVISWLMDNDACFANNFNPETRQYGIADLSAQGEPRTAAFTGSQTLAEAGHITGTTYSIQGNILSGLNVLEAMEAGFINSEGPLAFKLMAAMQGANIVGADSRCTDEGTSSTTSYLRVFKPNDTPDAPYLELNVLETPTGVEPIDSLQVLFDNWALNSTEEREHNDWSIRLFPNPATDYLHIAANSDLGQQELFLQIFTYKGERVLEKTINSGFLEVSLHHFKYSGIYFLRCSDRAGKVIHSDKLIVKN